MQISLSGKVALVTGAGSGIGRGVSQVLAGTGAHVVVVDINLPAAKQTVDLIQKAGGRATAMEGDVSSDSSMIAVMGRVAGELGGAIHVLVNNAGVELFKGIQDTSYSDWDKITDVDLKGIFISTKAGLPLLKKAGASGGAYVVNIASVHAHATLANLTAYAASKGGVISMTRSLAMELGPLGIHVNSISPGFVDTPMVRRWLNSMPNPEAELQRVHKLHAVPRIGTPEDIGRLIAFLASGHADFIVGANLTIDGGLTNRLQH